MKNDQDMSLRLLFASGIIASFFAYIANRTYISAHVLNTLEVLVFGLISSAALFSFLFLLLSAASMKYGLSTRIFTLDVSKKKIQLLYDVSVDVFAILPIFAAASIITTFIGKHLWKGSFVGHEVIYLVVVALLPTLVKLLWELMFKILGAIHYWIIKNGW